MQVEFITSIAVITPVPSESRRLYMDAFGLPLERLDGEYFASEEIGGCKPLRCVATRAGSTGVLRYDIVA
jgi:hypothetical protein